MKQIKKEIIRKQNAEIRELNQKERTQNGENMVEDNDLGRIFELALTNKIYLNRSNLYEIRN